MRRPSFSQVFVPVLLANSALALPRAVEYLQDLESRVVHALDVAKRATLHDAIAPYMNGANGVVSTSNYGGDPTPAPTEKSQPAQPSQSATTGASKRASLHEDMAAYDSGEDGVTSTSKYGDAASKKRASLAEDMEPYDDGEGGVLSNTHYGSSLIREKRDSLAQDMEPYDNGADGVTSTSHYGTYTRRDLAARISQALRAREAQQASPVEERMWDGSKPLPEA